MNARRILAAGTVAVAGAWSLASSAVADVHRTPGNEVAVGTTSADHPDGRYVAVANGGNAYTYDSNSAAVSTAGTANGGLVSVSGGGCAHDGWVVTVGGGCAKGAFVASASPFGPAGRGDYQVSSPPVVAVSGTDCADANYVGVAGGCASGVVAVGATGNATSHTNLVNDVVKGVAVSGTGSASSRGVSVAGGDAYATGGVASVSLTGDAEGGMVSVAPFGDAG